MTRRSRTRSTGVLLLGATLALLLALPATVVGRDPGGLATRPSTDLVGALAADGTFHGAPGVAGTVDVSAWTLVSDLVPGEPPRFEPAGVAVATPIGPWSAVGSNGAGDGALAGTLRPVADTSPPTNRGSNMTSGFSQEPFDLRLCDQLAAQRHRAFQKSPAE